MLLIDFNLFIQSPGEIPGIIGISLGGYMAGVALPAPVVQSTQDVKLKSRKMASTCTVQCKKDFLLVLKLPGGEQLVLSRDFIEWFRGFTDAEGSFIITKKKGNIFSFNFKIGLHIDDK